MHERTAGDRRRLTRVGTFVLVAWSSTILPCRLAGVSLLAAAGAAVQQLRVTEAELRPNALGGGNAGRVKAQGVVADQSGGLRVALLSGQAGVDIDDRSAFHISSPVIGCHQRNGGRIVCRNADHTMRVFLKPSRQGPPLFALKISLRRLPSTGTGTAAPTGPVTVTIRDPSTSDRIDIISDCHHQKQRNLTCLDRDRPNIVLIVTDDQRWDTLQYMPTTLSQLADRGVTFTNSFVTTSLCCPSRSSGLSGLYAHNHGVLANILPQGGAPTFVGRDTSTIATWLQSAGYRTGMYGKYLTGYSVQVPPYTTTPYIPPGWDEWHVLVAENYYNYQLTDNTQLVAYGNAEADYSTDVLAAKAVDFINSAHGQPFLLFLAPKAPHSDGGGLPKPAPRHAGAFAGIASWRPPSWDEDDVSDKAAWVQALPRASYSFGFVTVGTWADATRRYGLESLLAVDEAVGAVVDALDATGQSDNTVIVYTSDNGICWLEHRLNGKPCEFEECLRVPLIIRYPRMITTQRAEAGIALNIDLAPTLAALAGVTPPTPVNGRSLVPLLQNQPDGWRTDFLFEQWDFNTVYNNTEAGVRTHDWKYVEYDNSAEERELFDLQVDPFELDGATPLVSHPEVVAPMQARLAQLLTE